MSERVLWIDVAKVLTMILVVLGHSTYYKILTNYGGIDFSNVSALQSTIYRVLSTLTGFIYTFHMPFFMALSGMTFSMTYIKSRSISSLVSKKFQRLLIPFFFVTLFISVPLKIGGGYYDHSEHPFWDIVFGQFLLFGNSHLWFVVSLFIITIVFCFLCKLLKFRGSIIFWIVSLIVAYLGLFCERFGGFFGLPGAMRNFIFFALGFVLFNRINKWEIKKNNILVIFLSWVIMFLVFLIITQVNNHLKGFSFFTYIPMALWGCVNMTSTCKYISYHMNFKSSLFTSLNKESYNIYLFSDPFNYVFIPVAALVMGAEIVDKESTSLLIYILRVLTSIIFAYLIIWGIKLIRQSSAFFIRKIKDLNAS